jgi:DNA-binding NarL/FixJ family response regulator
MVVARLGQRLEAALAPETVLPTIVVSIKTVQNHVSSIFNKLQVADRAQATIGARDAGLG